MSKKISLEQMYKGIVEEQAKIGINQTICLGLAQFCEMLAEQYKDTKDKIKREVKEKCPTCGKVKRALRNNYSEHFLKQAKIFRALAEIHKAEIKSSKSKEVKNGKRT